MATESTKSRTESDQLSGLAISQPYEIDRYEGPFSDDELKQHFTTFKSFDLDDSGFISPANLKEIMDTLEIQVTAEQLTNMIDEVAILCGHDNDGQLSYRDYVRCLEYEREKNAVNAEIDAIIERKSQQDEGEADGADDEIELTVHMRGSSFATLDMVARGRIARFEQVIKETVKKENKSDKQVRSEARFASKLAKFQQPVAAPVARAETAYKRSVQDKLHAFEAANKTTSQAELKKTWKKVSTGQYALKSQMAGGAPPPKRNIADLP